MPLRRLACSLAAVLAVAALTSPAAIAMSDYPLTPAPAQRTAAGPAPEPLRVVAPAVVEADRGSGFDWGSAAAGAGVAAAIVAFAGGAAVTVARHDRTPTTHGRAR